MNLADTLIEIWRQSLADGLTEVVLAGGTYQVDRTRKAGLRTVSFLFETHAIEGIEQNPETKSRWAQLAREGQRIMQFSSKGRFVGNVCEGKLTRYPSWKSQGLPE